MLYATLGAPGACPERSRMGRFPALPYSAALRAGSIGLDGGGIIPIHAVALKR